MLQVGYPGLSRHNSKHRELLIEFEHLEQRFLDIETDPFLIEMGLTIKELLIDHLLTRHSRNQDVGAGYRKILRHFV